MVKIQLMILITFLVATYLTGCSNNTSVRIKDAISTYATKENTELKSMQVDSLKYSLADSTVYYNHFLHSLEERSESFSKMARLRTSLAQSHINAFLSGNEQDGYSSDKNKNEVDKSLRDLQQNEREWNVINDSMDLMLNAMQKTDTMKKVFYNVSFSLNAVLNNKRINHKMKAILNKDDLKVVVYE